MQATPESGTGKTLEVPSAADEASFGFGPIRTVNPQTLQITGVMVCS